MTEGYLNLTTEISSYINSIQEPAYWAAQQASLMRGLAWLPQDAAPGIAARNFWSYSESTMKVVGESDEVQSSSFTPTAGNTVTPTRKALSHFISYARWSSEPQDTRVAARQNITFAGANATDESLVDLFSSLTGGTAGTADAALTWTHIMAAKAMLDNQVKNNIYRVACVLHPYQWHDLAKAASIATATAAAAPNYTNSVTERYFVQSAAGVDFFLDSNIDIDSSSDAIGAMFVVGETLAFDPRLGGLRLAAKDVPERDGAEIIGNYWYGVGVRKPTWGVQIISDATTPA